MGSAIDVADPFLPLDLGFEYKSGRLVIRASDLYLAIHTIVFLVLHP